MGGMGGMGMVGGPRPRMDRRGMPVEGAQLAARHHPGDLSARALL
jgi:hypothetical protein